ncbi:hypothetical protein FORMB_18690 [Formosa sp. Hel1_33_131]|uniref:hypothetical protein n=1 Tax=Formosa sp. Hel1_33_131 TaxID=1336794 RepID=UPI00084E1334|nr:hypothetical protein [Formosa sp. Hel1_33_131]AOR28899.1 hypothetical protein FORMB_18690 [Formosa sp. Hel1_33_131]
MADKKITRQLSIFINGKEIKNSLGGIGREIGIIKKKLKEANDPKDIKKYKAELDKLGKAYGKVKTEIYGVNKTLKDGKTSVLGYVKAFAGGFIIADVLKAGFRAAREFVNESIQLAEEAKGVEFAFKQIEGSSEILERARTATRGLITNLDIKKAANVFKNFKIDMEPFPELLEFVSTRAAQTGENFDGMLNSLVEGLSKESKLRIDNLGISQKDLNAELEKTPNFVQAVANIAKKELTSAGSILDDAANSSLKWNVSLENLQLRIGKLALKSGLIKDIKSAGASFLDAIAPADRFSEKLRQQQFETNSLVTAITRANQSQKIRQTLINELQTKYPNFLKNLDIEKVTNKQLRDRLKEVNIEYRERIKLEALKEISADKQKEGVEAFRKEYELNKEIGELRVKSKVEIAKTDADILEFYNNEGGNKIVGATSDHLKTLISIGGKLNEINSLKEKQAKISEELQALDEKASEFVVTPTYTEGGEGVTPTGNESDLTEEEKKRIATLKDLYKKGQKELNDLIKKGNEDRLLNQKQGIEKELLAIDQKYARLKEKFILSEEEKKALSVTELAAREDALTELDDQKAREKQELKIQRDAEFKEELDAIKAENKLLEDEAKLELEIEKATTEEERQLAVIDKAQYVANVLLEIEKNKLLKEYKLKNATASQIAALETQFALKKAAATKVFDKQREKANKDGAEQEKATINERRQAYADLFGNIAQLLGENTAAGKAAAIAQATINTYQGVTEVWRAKSILPEPFGTAAKVVSTGVVLASGLKSVGVIKGTGTGFYDGGPTGDKAIYKDEFGAVTGVVHENEWVAPEWMNKSPRYAPTINWLEKERKKEMGQFFDGGNTSEPSSIETATETDTETADPNAMNFALMQMLEKFSAKLDEGIKAYTVRDYDDFIERKEIDQEHNEIFENTRHS